jgi:hypothetical protein
MGWLGIEFIVELAAYQSIFLGTQARSARVSPVTCSYFSKQKNSPPKTAGN